MARISAGAKASGKQLGRERLAAGQTQQHQQQKERAAKAPAQQPHRQSEKRRATETAQQTAQRQQEGRPQQAHGCAGALAGSQPEAKPQQRMHESKAAAEPPAGQQAPPAEASSKHAEPRQSNGATTAAELLVAGGRQAILQSQGTAEKGPAADAQQQQQPLPSIVLKGSLLQNQLSGRSDAQSQQLSSQAGTAEQWHAQDQAKKPCGLPAEPGPAQHQQLLSQADPAEQMHLQSLAQVLTQPEHRQLALQSLRQAAGSPAACLVAQQPQGADSGGWWAPQQHQGLQPDPRWVQQLSLTNGYVQQPQPTMHQQQQLLLLARLQAQLAHGPSGGSSMSTVPVQGTQTALAAALAASRSRDRQPLPSVVLAAPSQPLVDPTADALRAARASLPASGPRLAEQGQCGMSSCVALAEPQPPLSGAAAAVSAAPAALGNDNFDWAAWMQPEDLVGGIAGRTKRQASRTQPRSQHQQAASIADPDFTSPADEFDPRRQRQRRRPVAQHRAQPSEQPAGKHKRARSSGQQPLRQGKRRKAPPWEDASEDSAAAAGPGSAAEGQSLPAAARRRGAVRQQQAERPRRDAKPSKGWGRRQQQGSQSSHDRSPAAGTSSSDPEISEAEGPHLPSQALGKSRLSNLSAGVGASQQPAARLTRRASQEAVLAR